MPMSDCAVLHYSTCAPLCLPLPLSSLDTLGFAQCVESQGGKERHLPRSWSCHAFNSLFALKMKVGADHIHLSHKIISFSLKRMGVE